MLDEGVAEIERTSGGKRLLVLANATEREYSLNIDKATDLLTDDTLCGNITLGAKKVKILKTEV